MNKLFSLLRFTLGSMLMAGIVYIGVVYALNSWDTGYQVTSSQQKDITLQDGSCRRITNNATNRFIPTKTMAEWNAFNAVAGGQGVSVGSCATSGPYSYSAWGSCSVTCGGGTQYRTEYCYYDSCYSPQATSQSCNTQACATSGPYSYSAWGSCSVTCGGGTQYRTEYCYYTSCYSPQATSQSCNTQACGSYQWKYISGLCRSSGGSYYGLSFPACNSGNLGATIISSEYEPCTSGTVYTWTWQCVYE